MSWFTGSPSWMESNDPNLGMGDTSSKGSVSGTEAGIGGVGAGIAALGTIESLSSSMDEASVKAQAAAASGKIAQLDMLVNAQKQQMFALQTQRTAIENMRRAQTGRSLSEAAAANQGALYGSGVKGGQAGISAKAGIQNRDLNQNYMIGSTIFGLMNAEDQQKINISQLESRAATDAGNAGMWSGIAAIGGDVMKAAPFIAAL